MSEKLLPCPICGGRGTVEHNFYTRSTVGSSIAPVQCRACLGLGYIRLLPESVEAVLEAARTEVDHANELIGGNATGSYLQYATRISINLGQHLSNHDKGRK